MDVQNIDSLQHTSLKRLYVYKSLIVDPEAVPQIVSLIFPCIGYIGDVICGHSHLQCQVNSLRREFATLASGCNTGAGTLETTEIPLESVILKERLSFTHRAWERLSRI
jgi:hypothetical protein